MSNDPRPVASRSALTVEPRRALRTSSWVGIRLRSSATWLTRPTTRPPSRSESRVSITPSRVVASRAPKPSSMNRVSSWVPPASWLTVSASPRARARETRKVSPPDRVAGSRCLPLHSSRTRRLSPPRCSPAPRSSACSRVKRWSVIVAEPLVGGGDDLAQPLGEDVRREPHPAAGCRRSCPRPGRPGRPSARGRGGPAPRPSSAVGRARRAGASSRCDAAGRPARGRRARSSRARPDSASRAARPVEVGGLGVEGGDAPLLGQHRLRPRRGRPGAARAASRGSARLAAGQVRPRAPRSSEPNPASAAAASAAVGGLGQLVGAPARGCVSAARASVRSADGSAVAGDERRRPT